MEKYHFSNEEFTCLENLRIPLAVYQFLDKRVVTRILSKGFCDLFDFESREVAYDVMRNNIYSIAHPDDVARIANSAYRFATEGGKFEEVYRIRTRNSSVYRIVHAIGEHVYTKTGERLAYVWFTNEGEYTGENDTKIRSINDSYRAALREESMIQVSHYDYLTGLPNMAYFFELVEAGRRGVIKKERTPAVLFINLNGMKFYNRKYGFAEGDRLLREISKILVRHFKSENCSRFGQDHFAVFTHSDGLEDKLKTIMAECSMDDERNVSVRIGVYLCDEEDENASTICDKAKYACDTLQSSAVSEYAFFDENMQAEMKKRQIIIDDFETALKEKWIKVFYQPIIRTANGKVCDEEALARWVDPVRGLLSPAEFIPVLEEAKLIYKLDLYVVDQVLEKIKTIEASGLYIVPQSVNLSRIDFETCDIVEEIRKRVDDAGIGRDKLTIEITESVVGSDFEFIKEQVARFQKLGFNVWMDDFGSGYSSLDVLQNIRFDLIKFDMRFMQRFNEGEEGKIILTELIRMAIGLGIETVCEGVETDEQVEFLREVGCSRLQGFFYCKAIPYEEIVERNKNGIQIGYENPDETDYYATIGRINLYDTSVIANDDHESMRNFFNTMPMAIIEITNEDYMVVRCNNTYRALMERMFGFASIGQKLFFRDIEKFGGFGIGFLKAMRQCAAEGDQIIVDEVIPDGATVHSFLKRVSINPVTGVAALAVAVLAVVDRRDKDKGLSYAQIANSLSQDYFDLFYVNLQTENFIHYSSGNQYDDLNLERHGKDFFRTSKKDAMKLLYEEDREYFVNSFTKANVIKSLSEHGAFTLTYRMMIDDEPIYVNMKAVRMKTDNNYIIIGVNNVNAQMKEKQALQQLEQERIIYSRISALSGDYICIYTVDPESDSYDEYSATVDYEEFGLEKSGENFFEESRENIVDIIFPEDKEYFLSMFTKEKIMLDIEKTGVYELQYRLIIDGYPKHVSLKAALVQEKGGKKLIVGLNNIDARVKQDMEYAHNLSVAQSHANIDALTGVKNHFAFVEAEERINSKLKESRETEFAVVLFDIRGLEEVNNKYGHGEGDEYLKKACRIICDIFKRSPVYRIEADHFAVIATGNDYDNMEMLLEKLEKRNEEKDDMFIVFGSARYEGKGNAEDVFVKASDDLHRNKEK